MYLQKTLTFHSWEKLITYTLYFFYLSVIKKTANHLNSILGLLGQHDDLGEVHGFGAGVTKGGQDAVAYRYTQVTGGHKETSSILARGHKETSSMLADQ
jgi:hypothetical protein